MTDTAIDLDSKNTSVTQAYQFTKLKNSSYFKSSQPSDSDAGSCKSSEVNVSGDGSSGFESNKNTPVT